MSYSQFTLDRVKTDFDLTIQEDQPLFTDLVELNPSPLLQQILQEYLPLALAINSEKARSEFKFNVVPGQGLTGFCDLRSRTLSHGD